MADFEPIEEDSRALSDSHSSLRDCEEYVRRHVPYMVYANLMAIARQSIQPVEDQLLERVPQIIQDCVREAFQQFRARREGSGSPESLLGAQNSFNSMMTSLPADVQRNFMDSNSTEQSREFSESVFGTQLDMGLDLTFTSQPQAPLLFTGAETLNAAFASGGLDISCTCGSGDLLACNCHADFV